MAGQLIDEMTSTWKPEEFKDDFASAVKALVEKKAKAGDKATVEPFEEAPDVSASNVVDLSELLRQSLGAKKQGGKASSAPQSSPAPAKKAAATKTTAKTAGSKKAASPKTNKAA